MPTRTETNKTQIVMRAEMEVQAAELRGDTVSADHWRRVLAGAMADLQAYWDRES